MAAVFRLINTIQEYAWGSRTAIPELVGNPSPADKPQAELWMGAHPKAPSRIILAENRRIPLPELIARDPAGTLGATVAQKYSGRLPFLFKALAAALPLSIQAHPNLKQAREGFRRENELGIPLDAFQRNYRDENHKPEVISALTPFWALNGFRPIPEMLALLHSIGFPSISEHLNAFRKNPDPAGLKIFFAALMRLDREFREKALEKAVDWARGQLNQEQRSGTAGGESPTPPIAHWLVRLQELYPGDIGVLSPLLLNLILLQPGDTMFLEAGVLHAYLEGTGIELMANSDNVIRGGLTQKHMDVEELLSILRFEGQTIRLAVATETVPGERVFRTPAAEFRLTEIHVHPDRPYRSPGTGSIELMICLDGEGAIDAVDPLPLSKGDSLMIPASAPPYTIHGSVHLYKAFVPLD
jgi:mannose-6-phosphate isomerase